MRTFATQPNRLQQGEASAPTVRASISAVDPFRTLQRAIGNQALLRQLQTSEKKRTRSADVGSDANRTQTSSRVASKSEPVGRGFVPNEETSVSLPEAGPISLEQADAGLAPDAGVSPDAGPLGDAGVRTAESQDAGPLGDADVRAAEPQDAGQPSDAGVSAVAPQDAGPLGDAGGRAAEPMDAGSPKAPKKVQRPPAGGTVAEGGALNDATITAVKAALKNASPKRYIVYKDGVKIGGTLAWRANNPGNLRGASTKIASTPGAVGTFAVFATIEDGREAQKNLYLNTYGDMKVSDAIAKLTPPSENDTKQYLKDLKAQGIDLDATVKSQIEKIMVAVKKNEGMHAGVEIPRVPDQSPPAP